MIGIHIVPKIKVKRQQKGIRKLREGFQLCFAASPTKFLALGTRKRTRVEIATFNLTFFQTNYFPASRVTELLVPNPALSGTSTDGSKMTSVNQSPVTAVRLSRFWETISGTAHIRISLGFLPEILLYINFAV